ncbi:MAG TPA: NAD(P)H-dependent oxidoreductase [Spirochaetota bacterium]|nr:NAD(P)H-dependent oxidoreductase [Spirochaetota bacterium]HPC40497.1 NAD(P)H-dependent oxidoreductase [Spirochaetota bacterium]HPL17431.1 NAD(P)H-dependent oxidoreductase [Spirochaetota bacterium]HQF07995.1 NAD(P)H-dependent oxidoreductase [Spirochaetota bacterium]HQH96555.1 NAD(P)H-dependent oxidoreductase [Spirochaetota bacterium]
MLSGQILKRKRNKGMNILVIVANPREGSFNNAIAQRVQQTLREMGHSVLYHDLYRVGFGPLLTAAELPKDCVVDPGIMEYWGELRSSDGIVIIHPNWWGQPPAILKGWIDRVIRPGIAYEFREGDDGEGVPLGLRAGKKALVWKRFS